MKIDYAIEFAIQKTSTFVTDLLTTPLKTLTEDVFASAGDTSIPFPLRPNGVDRATILVIMWMCTSNSITINKTLNT